MSSADDSVLFRQGGFDRNNSLFNGLIFLSGGVDWSDLEGRDVMAWIWDIPDLAGAGGDGFFNECWIIICSGGFITRGKIERNAII
jgi:hypothetical protein